MSGCLISPNQVCVVTDQTTKGDEWILIPATDQQANLKKVVDEQALGKRLDNWTQNLTSFGRLFGGAVTGGVEILEGTLGTNVYGEKLDPIDRILSVAGGLGSLGANVGLAGIKTEGSVGTANPGTLTPIFKDKETGINSINPTASVGKGDVNRLAYDTATKKTVMHEGIAAAQIENTLGGKLVRVESGSSKSPDFIFESGPYKGKTVDFMWTNTEKAVQINQYFKNNIIDNHQQLIDHIKKADIVPIDYRVLKIENQKIVNEWLKGMTQEQRSKVLILR